MPDGAIPTHYVPCDLCGSWDQEMLFIKRDHITGQEFTLVECACGMAFVNPMPTDEAIQRLYPEDYLKDKPQSHALYEAMLRLLPHPGEGKLLDVGCGRGDFIARASHAGWQVEGVDLLAWRNPGEAVPIHVGDFIAMDLPARHYDVITAWALLEHTPRPSLFFRKISRLLKDEGMFLFTAPNFAAPGMRTSCSEDIPRHLSLFSEKSVARHLNAAGLEVEKIYHNDRLYTAYPFGLVRYALRLLTGSREIRCSAYENRAVRLLKNRQFRGNAAAWLKEAAATLGIKDLAVDSVDLIVGVLLAYLSKLARNYGVMTVAAKKSRQKKSNP
ncbi:MAG: class I SAM-dependent methyltransferase [Desulfomonilaceae bacterium]